MTGGGQPIPAGLSCPPLGFFEQWLAMDSKLLFIAFTAINWKYFAKCRYCLLVYENSFLEIHPFTGGGQPIPAGLSYPPPMMGGGQPIPAGLSCPPTQIFEQWMAMDSELLLITFKLLMDMLHKILILPAGIQKPISWNSPIYSWGATYPSWFTLPPTQDFGNGDCLHIMKWLWSITMLKMMKMSYNPDIIFCLFTLISHLKYLPWRVGGNLSQLVYLAPHLDFWAVIGYGFWIAANCCYNY